MHNKMHQEGFYFYKIFYEKDVADRMAKYLQNKGYETRIAKKGTYWHLFTNPNIDRFRPYRPNAISYDVKKYAKKTFHDELEE